ncbi:MAG: 3-phosphoshikimate 1-carboxyvinyltransferase [Rickettsiales bacterium]|jgi:3-phosphoshikimate 1-carboxyvinyltransferase|nr:3-phosphoshikimate 1-carboxyvinyltransferase [Rickettsiales bacterium]|tara:strand:+ start:12665 stop:13975 length:1311 start_codon:yes stop_codon:yes gene_type:complete
MKSLSVIKNDIALKGEIKIPGDKSISHRSLIFAALANGQTKITNLLESEDVINTANALRNMSVDIEKKDNFWVVNGSGLVGLMEPQKELNMGNSGTAARLLAGLVAPYKFNSFFIGDSSLTKRPMQRIFKPIREFGANIISRNENYLPFVISGCDEMMPIDYHMDVASAQVKSCILLSSLAVKGMTTIYEPTKCRNHSEIMMKFLGLNIIQEDYKNGKIIKYQGYQEYNAKDIEVINDISSAAFFIVAALLIKDSEITLSNIGINPLRSGIITILKKMGGNIELQNIRQISGEDVADIKVCHSKLKAVNVEADMAASMIDEYPILAIACANAVGTSRMSGLMELRVKESDRLEMIAQNLENCGVNVKAGKDYIEIEGQSANQKIKAKITSAMDHRIAMSFIIMGLTMSKGVEIDDISMINTSFPDFVKIFNQHSIF